MKMVNCFFTYPGNTVPTLFDITIQVSLKSRVGCVGENGAGKSTMIKILTGELVAQQGDTWKHPNARVAYVAQHAFHHIEEVSFFFFSLDFSDFLSILHSYLLSHIHLNS